MEMRIVRGASLLLVLAGCGDGVQGGENGKVRLLLTAEETITDGLMQGSGVENTRDYDVEYTKYLAVVGNVEVARSGGGSEQLDEVVAVDMTRVGTAGVELGILSGLEPGEWDLFSFETPAADASTSAGEGVSEADLAKLVAEGWTYWIEGIVHGDERDVKFVIQTAVPTLFDHCELDGEPGVTVVSGRTETATMTLHGDHIFFNAFPVATEGTITRLAGWVIDADADEDGMVSTEDLAALDATEVFTTTRGYSLDGAPEGIVVTTALDYVRAQLATQGHYKVEGECIWHYQGATGD